MLTKIWAVPADTLAGEATQQLVNTNHMAHVEISTGSALGAVAKITIAGGPTLLMSIDPDITDMARAMDRFQWMLKEARVDELDEDDGNCNDCKTALFEDSLSAMFMGKAYCTDCATVIADDIRRNS